MSQPRLLLIEDDYDVAEMLTAYFGSINYTVQHADNGTEGIELARSAFPNLILLDVMLPDMDGYDVCARLRQYSLTRYIPTLFLTQRDERASKVRGLELGADDYITKPFDIEELRLRVDGSIRRATRENLHETRTGLPTGPLVAEEMNRHTQAGAVELRFELRGFEAYQEHYSFMASADVLFHAARVLRAVIAREGTPNDFVGFNDETFVVATYADAVAIESAVQADFNTQVTAFYTFSDVQAGGILMKPGTPEEHLAPLMSLARV